LWGKGGRKSVDETGQGGINNLGGGGGKINGCYKPSTTWVLSLKRVQEETGERRMRDHTTGVVWWFGGGEKLRKANRGRIPRGSLGQNGLIQMGRLAAHHTLLSLTRRAKRGKMKIKRRGGELWCSIKKSAFSFGREGREAHGGGKLGAHEHWERGVSKKLHLSGQKPHGPNRDRN